MMLFNACPRCEGPVLDCKYSEDYLCVVCGWRRADIPEEVRAEVTERSGKNILYRDYPKIATGKPPVSGWQRELRKRQQRDSA